MKNRGVSIVFIVCLSIILASCGAKKAAVGSEIGTSASTVATAQSPETQKLTFVQKVYDKQVYSQNITGDMSFTLKMGNEDITVPGSLHMRKNEVIRIQLFIPILGSEVGRVEFTPDYVLIVDRMHKEYIKEDYNQLSFLRDNGINFYSLQALFWNQLMIPGKQTVGDSDLYSFDADLNPTNIIVPITYNKGDMKYVWSADKTFGWIYNTKITYLNAGETTTLDWDYSKFQTVGSTQFPAKQAFTLTSNAKGQNKKVNVTIDMDDVKTTDSEWETHSTVSDTYRKVSAQDVLSKLLSM